ncbi:cell division protein FtsZ [Moraxella sp. ZY210820]|uniref:cell division protein FtsZ n=1 Tax=unclassified Moraxella TaxID=2685852 RepID=UPI002731A4E2|nr:cell division protein FtsZ [Moraxella sp. ZY210820]WLF83877.1 cell division protein FtsZ [Moraxella sp. ZY210820]
MSTFAFLDENGTSDGNARITVLGVGGGGGNAIQHMLMSNITGVKFVCANTDRQALERVDTENKIQLGEQSTRGLGAGANPEVGKISAEESLQEIKSYLEGTDMLFVTAGMGGGTGTGAAPVIAKLAKEMGILTVGVVTTPFSFEGKKRLLAAEKGIEALEENVDSLIVIPNQRLLKVYRNITMADAYKKVDDVLLNSVRNIFDLIIRPGYINLDFADLQTAMSSRGYAMMGAGLGRGDDRARQAAEQAIRSPLLEGVTSMDAKSLIINITSGEDPEYCATLEEVEEITAIANQIANLDEGNIFFGTAFDPELRDEIRVTIVATGLERSKLADEPRRTTTVTSRPAITPVAHTSAPEKPAVANTGADLSDAPSVTLVMDTPPAPEPEIPVQQPTRLSIGDFLKNRQK